jgi:hypothetical protein
MGARVLLELPDLDRRVAASRHRIRALLSRNGVRRALDGVLVVAAWRWPGR